MTDHAFDLTRRKALAALGTIGAASAGAGLGTSAYFSDDETFEDNTLTAGSLDLKVDWEEHYSDWSDDEEAAVSDMQMPTAGSTLSADEVNDGYVGLPDPENAVIAIPEDDLGDFMDATALEAFPDLDDDGLQEVEGYQPCTDGADVPEDMDPTASNALRTRNEDTYDSGTGTVKPLVALDDVKPGDFGELTLSFHLCDNPGYVWATGALESASENGVTEPEGDDPDEMEGTVELLDEIRTVWWYDSRGDNVLQTNCPEKLYLVDSVSGSDTDTVLFEVELVSGGSGNAAELTQLYPNQGSVPPAYDDYYNQTDAIATTPSGDQIIFYDKSSAHVGRYDIVADSFTDEGAVSNDPGGVVLAGYSPLGTLWAASQDTDQLYTVDPPAPSVTAQGDTGIDLVGADIVFASDGTLYIWTASSADQGLYKVDDPSSDPTAVAVSNALGSVDAKVTGIAIRDGGTGDIVASDTKNDRIIVVDRTDGSVSASYPMELNGEQYAYDFGDMTAGKYCGEVFRRGTLREDLAALSSGNGMPLDGNRASPFNEIAGDPADAGRECFVPGVNHYIGFGWYLPVDHANEIQSDSVAFDLGFYTEQCRHNDGSGMAPETTNSTATTTDST